MRLTTALALIVALSSPARADIPAVNPSTTESFAAQSQLMMTPAARDRFNAAVLAAWSLRAWMAGDPQGMRVLLNDRERRVLDGLTGDKGLRQWQQFFRGSVVAVGHVTADRPRVGFYNPLIDGWLVADLTRAASGGMVLDALTPFPGAAITDVPKTALGLRPP